MPRTAISLFRMTDCLAASLVLCGFLGSSLSANDRPASNGPASNGPASNGPASNGPATAQSMHSPLSPKESLEHLVVHPGLRVELVAAEPQVIDPVAIAFDANGGLYVVEMSDYPLGPKPGQPPLSRIRLLEDRDGDGRYEHAVIFADKLLFATGLQPWRDGLIVTLGGRVVWMKDSNGDGRADIQETWFSGFAEKNSQLRANHPTFGLDNHIYIANGLRGGTAIAVKKPWNRGAKPISLRGMDLRFDPLTGQYESISGNCEFGFTFDDFGNRFISSNRNPCDHVVLENRYLKRNPYLGVSSLVENVSPIGGSSHVYPLSRAWVTSTQHAGQFTAACGVTMYRGDALPAGYYGNSFTCEPTGNLVHRDVLSQHGATFASHTGRKGVEFLASPDEWFRPVNLANGPDGAFYVVDMYRAVIEHPQWVPDELKNRPDQRYGEDRGRIYRIVPATATGHKQRHQPRRLSKQSGRELVALLDSTNSWQRETAARLLFERQDKSVHKQLLQLAKTARTPQGRVQALWTLNGLGLITADVLDGALSDQNPRVREQAVRLAEPFLAGGLPGNAGNAGNAGKTVSLLPQVLKLAGDADPRVRFQVALSLGEAKNSQSIVGPLTSIALRNPSDRWTRIAVVSSVPNDIARLTQTVLSQLASGKSSVTDGTLSLISETTRIIGSRRKKDEIGSVLTTLGSLGSAKKNPALSRVAWAGLVGLGSGLARRGGSLSASVPRLAKPARASIEHVFRRAADVAGNKGVPNALRVEAIASLRYADYKIAGPTLLKLATSERQNLLRLAAIDVISVYNDPKIGPGLLADFLSQVPAVRRAILDVMLSRISRTRILLDAIAAKRIAVTELGPTRVRRLTRHPNLDIRKRAKKLLAAAIPADRKKVLAAYQPALSLKASARRGRKVFEKNCTTCHRIGKLGVNVAPNISDARTKTPAQLLTSILDPNRAIDNNYFSYTILTVNGKQHTGIIAAETSASVTLKQPENKTVTVLRQDIEMMRSNGVSLMPVGLEKNVSVQQMADLVSFIKNWRYLDGRIPIKAGQ